MERIHFSFSFNSSFLSDLIVLILESHTMSSKALLYAQLAESLEGLNTNVELFSRKVQETDDLVSKMSDVAVIYGKMYVYMISCCSGSSYPLFSLFSHV